MSREANLLKNTFILGIGTFLPKFASILVLPLLTGHLTKSEYGTYDLITVLVSLILPTLTLQIQQAAFRFLIDSRGSSEKISTIITNIMLFEVPVATLGAIALFFVMPIDATLMRFLVCLYYWVDVVENALIQCARGMGDNMSYSISATLCSLGHLVFALLFVTGMGMGLLGAVYMLLCSDLVELIYIVVKTGVVGYIDLRLRSHSVLKELLAYSWPMVPNSMSTWVMRLSNRLIITFFMGAAANAAFAVAYKIPQILSMAQQTFTMAWQENASIAAEDDDNDVYYSKMFNTIFNLVAGAMALLLAATPLLFVLLIRGDYDDAYTQVPILFMGMFFYCISGFLGGIYVAKKRTTSIGITTIAAASINLVLDVCGVPVFGLYGASFAMFISYLFLSVFRMVEIKRFTDIVYNIKHCLVIVLVLTLMSVLCYTRMPAAIAANVVIGIATFVVLDWKTVMLIVKAVIRKLKGVA